MATDPPVPKKAFKFPKAMGACADRYYTLMNQRLDLQHQAEKVEEEEKALKAYIIDNLPKSESTGAAGKLARVTVRTKVVPQVKDWNALCKYVKKNDAFDLFRRQVTTEAVQARWDLKKKVPGVEPFTAVTLSVNKV